MPHSVSHGIAPRLKPTWEDLHPWLLAATIVVHMGSRNMYWFTLGDVLAMLIPTLLPTSAVFLVLLLLRRRATHAALLTSWTCMLCAYYGLLFDRLERLPTGGGDFLRHGVLIAIGLGVTAVLWNLAGDLKRVSRFLSLMAAIVLIVISTKFGLMRARELQFQVTEVVQPSLTQLNTATEAARDPDVYYIILDGYGRGDVLQEFYDFDNSEFLDGLRQRGFYIADKSCTNYPKTAFSLSSSLNMRYHESFSPQAGYKPLAQLLRTHEVGRCFRERGYQLVHFNTYFMPTACSEISHLSLGEPTTWFPPGTPMMKLKLIQHSALRFVNGGDKGVIAAEHRRALSQLTEMPTLPGPKFTFCHLVAPHPPFVFNRAGQSDWNIDQNSRSAYIDQLIYLNHEVMNAIDAIKSKSKSPPIVIVQSDHGPGFCSAKTGEDPLVAYVQERVPILNAYLVPETLRESLYSTITPVNTFRLLLSECFGVNYEPLPDRHFTVRESGHPVILEITDKIHDGVPKPELLGPLLHSQATPSVP